MIIRNYDSGYVVIRHVHSSSLKDIYICRKTTEKTGREYTVIRVKDIGLCQQIIEFFTREIDEEKFSDFVECFTFEGKMNLVFLYSQAPGLAEKLNEEACPFAERLETAHKLLERIIYLDMPPAFLADALEMDHITVDRGLEIRFNYELTYIYRLSDYTVREIGMKMEGVFRQIFSVELARKTCPEIREYMDWLKTGDYGSYMDIFYKFNQYYAVLRTRTDIDRAQPATVPFRTWAVIRKILGILKKILMAALLIGAFGYLIYTIVDFVAPKVSDAEAVERFDYIGTVEIQDEQIDEEQTE